MPVDDSYPGLEEPLTGIGDAEPIRFPSPRSAALRRLGPSQSAVAAAAMATGRGASRTQLERYRCWVGTMVDVNFRELRKEKVSLRRT
jgi:hypothetical protein